MLSASAETMFRFHADPHNLIHVMPPTMKVLKLITDVPAREGGRIEIHCRDWGIIPMRWVCQWRSVHSPDRLVDEMLEGPFRMFVHEHYFEPISDTQCMMRDTVTYQWGKSWWGALVSESFVKIYLTILFRYRHHRTRRWACGQLQRQA
jgi:ligand-binding SRPBCC domain-containing protein